MPMLTTLRIGLPVEPRPLARAHRVGERRHPVEHLVHLGDHVDAVDDERAASRHPQRDVEHRAVLGDVDLLPGEHRVAPLRDARLFRERDEQPQRLVGDAVLRVVEEEARRLDGEPLGAAGIVGEELAEMRLPHLRRRAPRAPARRGCRCAEAIGHCHSPRTEAPWMRGAPHPSTRIAYAVVDRASQGRAWSSPAPRVASARPAPGSSPPRARTCSSTTTAARSGPRALAAELGGAPIAQADLTVEADVDRLFADGARGARLRRRLRGRRGRLAGGGRARLGAAARALGGDAPRRT